MMLPKDMISPSNMFKGFIRDSKVEMKGELFDTLFVKFVPSKFWHNFKFGFLSVLR